MCSVFLVALNSVSLDSPFSDFKKYERNHFPCLSKAQCTYRKVAQLCSPKNTHSPPPPKAQQTSSSVQMPTVTVEF